MPKSVVSVVSMMGRVRVASDDSTAARTVAPARISLRAWSTSRMALLTTRPMSTTKPTMVSRSSVCGVNSRNSTSASTPPKLASGIVRITYMLSLTDRNSAASSRNSAINAIARFSRHVRQRFAQ